jgi:hypothetical protein
MDRQKIVEQLRRAEEQIASLAQSITRQRAVIAELKRDGHEINSAGTLLTHFLVLQALHEAECERLSQELAEHDAAQNSA